MNEGIKLLAFAAVFFMVMMIGCNASPDLYEARITTAAMLALEGAEEPLSDDFTLADFDEYELTDVGVPLDTARSVCKIDCGDDHSCSKSCPEGCLTWCTSNGEARCKCVPHLPIDAPQP